eukprot:1812051-Rhodomonas_salina.1
MRRPIGRRTRLPPAVQVGGLATGRARAAGWLVEGHFGGGLGHGRVAEGAVRVRHLVAPYAGDTRSRLTEREEEGGRPGWRARLRACGTCAGRSRCGQASRLTARSRCPGTAIHHVSTGQGLVDARGSARGRPGHVTAAHGHVTAQRHVTSTGQARARRARGAPGGRRRRQPPDPAAPSPL